MSNAPHLKVNSDHAHHLLGILSGNPPDGIVYHSVRRGQPESFFNLDLPIKYAPYPELHGLKWRHKLPTNHPQTEPSQGRGSTVLHTGTTDSTLDKHGSPPRFYFIFKSNTDPTKNMMSQTGNNNVSITNYGRGK